MNVGAAVKSCVATVFLGSTVFIWHNISMNAIVTKNSKRFAEPLKLEKKIVDDNGTVGTVILKPNGVGWKTKSARKYIFVEWVVFEEMLEKEPRAKEIGQ